MTTMKQNTKTPASFMALVLLIFFISCDCEKPEMAQGSSFKTARLDSLFTEAIKNNEIPAGVAFIARGGKTVYHKAFGMKNIETGEALKESDIFRIASMTKVVTAVAVMQLWERGLLFLDDPVSKYLPEYKNPRVLIEVLPDSSFTSRPAESEITIRQLLTHTSGIGYGFQSDTYNAMIIKNGISEGFEERPISTRENIRKLAALPLLHDPGEKYTYSLSIDVLGALVEVVSGESLDDYFYNYIFEPLEMDDTYFYLPDEKADRLVSVYEHNTGKTGFIPTTYPYTRYPVQGAKMYLSGGSDLSSTVKDIGTFAQMMMNKGIYNGTRILGSRAVEMITSKQTRHDWWNSEVGFCVSITNKNGAAEGPQSEGSYGWGGFFDTYCWVDPQKDFLAVLFLQMYPNNDFKFHEKFQQITYGTIDKTE